MRGTQNLQATVAWAAPFVNYQPLNIGGLEPALSIANMVLQTILGPPFCWRFNRSTATFACDTVNQDYAVAASDFGFLEKAWLKAADNSDLKELRYQRSIAATLEKARPAFISDHLEYDPDNDGNTLTFRLSTIPEALYAATVQYQKKAALMSSMASRWPIPDEFGYIYQWGFAALAQMLVNDARFPISNQKFIAHLLGAQDGLDDLQRNIFLGNWLEITREAARATLKTQQGTAARQS